MAESFYEPDGDRYVATELTRGPWDPGAQHAGPPAALIGREIERLGGGRLGGQRRSARPGRPHHLRDPALGADRAAARRGRDRPAGAQVEMVEATLTDGRRRGDAGARLAAADRRGRVREPPGRREPPRDRSRESQASSSTPATTSATTRRWSTASSAARSWSRARRRSGCGWRCRWSPARSRPRCSACWPPPTRATASAPRSTGAATCSSTSTSASTCTGCRWASGSASTRSRCPSRTGSGSPTRAL